MGGYPPIPLLIFLGRLNYLLISLLAAVAWTVRGLLGKFPKMCWGEFELLF